MTLTLSPQLRLQALAFLPSVLLGACCQNDLVSIRASPNGRRAAVVFERNCGAAAAGVVMHVSLVDSAAPVPTGVGNVFRVKDTSSTAGGSMIASTSVRWRNDSELQISYDPRAAVIYKRTRVQSVQVHYQLSSDTSAH